MNSVVGSATEGLLDDEFPRHLEEFAKGVVDSRDVVYYLSFTALGLFLTKQSIESYRWRS